MSDPDPTSPKLEAGPPETSHQAKQRAVAALGRLGTEAFAVLQALVDMFEAQEREYLEQVKDDLHFDIYNRKGSQAPVSLPVEINREAFMRREPEEAVAESYEEWQKRQAQREGDR